MLDLTVFQEKTRNLRFTDGEIIFEYLKQVRAASVSEQIEHIEAVIRMNRPELMVMIEESLSARHRLQCQCRRHAQSPNCQVEKWVSEERAEDVNNGIVYDG